MGVEIYPMRPILRSHSARAAVLTALVCLAAALALRYVLNVTIGNALPFVTVFGATAAAQWYGGRYAAISVALLALVGCVLMLEPAPGRTRVDEVGGVLGIVTLRLVVGQLLTLIQRYPTLVDAAFVIIAWVGIKLLAEYLHTIGLLHFEIPKWLSIGLIGVIFAIALWYARRAGPQEIPPGDDEATELLRDGH